MPLSRRGFLKGLVGTAAGILVAPEVLAEPERRVWALDNSMVRPPHELAHFPVPDWITKFDPHDTPLLDHIKVSYSDHYNYAQRFEYTWGGKYVAVADEIMQIAGYPVPVPGSAHMMIPVYRGNRYPKEVAG